MKNLPPLILDFDGSVLPLGLGEERVPLSSWQETIRFGCSKKSLFSLEFFLQKTILQKYGCVFTGSGDFHHVSLLLLRRALAGCANNSVDLVVCDNHPDNMRYPWGIHCGSWVYHATLLPQIRKIHVVGITSTDITLRHAWENYLTPFLRNKLTYWSIQQKASWLRFIRREKAQHSFTSASELIQEFLPVIAQSQFIYLSIDKDVCSSDYLRTNWDQGVFSIANLQSIAAACNGKLVGCDIMGEPSQYLYRSWFKRILTCLDRQMLNTQQEIAQWLPAHQACNRQLAVVLNHS